MYLEYIQYDTKSDLKLGEFNVGVTFESRILIDKDDFEKYISLAKTRNVLHEKPGFTPLVGIHENFVVLDYDSGMKEGREGIPKIMKKLTP